MGSDDTHQQGPLQPCCPWLLQSNNSNANLIPTSSSFDITQQQQRSVCIILSLRGEARTQSYVLKRHSSSHKEAQQNPSVNIQNCTKYPYLSKQFHFNINTHWKVPAQGAHIQATFLHAPLLDVCGARLWQKREYWISTGEQYTIPMRHGLQKQWGRDKYKYVFQRSWGIIGLKKTGKGRPGDKNAFDRISTSKFQDPRSGLLWRLEGV